MDPTVVVAEVKQVLYHWWDQTAPDEGSSHFGVSVQALIGSAGRDDANSFDAILCSPSMFTERFSVARWDTGFPGTAPDPLPGGDVLPVHGVWLMKMWSPAAFESALERLVRAMSPGPDWRTVADRIGRHLPWEFDYQYDDQLNMRAGLPRLAHSFWHDEYQPPQ